MIRSNSDGSFHTRLRRYISEFFVFDGERSHLRSRMTNLLQFCNDGCSFVHPRISPKTPARTLLGRHQNATRTSPFRSTPGANKNNKFIILILPYSLITLRQIHALNYIAINHSFRERHHIVVSFEISPVWTYVIRMRNIISHK